MWIIGLTYAALWNRVIDSVCVTVIELSTEKKALSHVLLTHQKNGEDYQLIYRKNGTH